MGEDVLGGLPLPIGIISAIALIIITLIKVRSADRVNQSKDQKEHMDRLTKERNDALASAEKYYDELVETRRQLMNAESKAYEAERINGGLQQKIENLSTVNQTLVDKVDDLERTINNQLGDGT